MLKCQVKLYVQFSAKGGFTQGHKGYKQFNIQMRNDFPCAVIRRMAREHHTFGGLRLTTLLLTYGLCA